MKTTVGMRGNAMLVRQFEVSVIDGKDRGTRVVSAGEELSIGSSEGNDLRLTDNGVSRHHCALRAVERGLELVDLGSRNGTFVGNLEITSCFVRTGAQLRVGQTTVSVQILDQDLEQPLASGDRHGAILGASPEMRRLYPIIEQCGRSTATVLIVGETGTGKELIAEAIHDASDRRDKPFVVVDCSALSHDLAESELFGHERGAFTGAETLRIGAFESARGGTVFLDEIGELPINLQQLLLRVLEARTVRRIGSNQQRPVDVRVISASHRDLRREVNQKRFRADLFYRLNVLRIPVPALRERTGDVELLAGHFWKSFRSDAPPEALLRHLASHHWPGNVRELRNAVERAAVLGWKPEQPESAVLPVLSTYQQAKERALWAWERGWVEQLLAGNAFNLSRAARAAKMGRTNLRELARKHGISTRPSTTDIEETDD
jgi:DNA-binding NtrC family response regulator